MKKGLRIALALVLAVVFMFTSCDNQTQTPPATDTVGYARFAGGDVQSRDLSADYELQAYADLYWFYDAEKADSFGTTGAGSMLKVPGDTEDGKGLDGQITLSQGLWNFTLYAYASIDEAGKPVEGTLAYKGETSGVTIRGGEVTTVPVAVSPQGATGTVKFGEASFSWEDSGKEKPVIRLTFTNNRENKSYVAHVTPDENFNLSGPLFFEEESSSLFGEESSSSIPVGFYTCKAEAFLVSAASEITEDLTSVTDMRFSLQVIGGATTVINGVITENSFGSVSFDVVTAESDVVVFQPTAGNNSVTFDTAPTEDDSKKTTVVDFGEKNLSETQQYVIDITVLSQVAADKGFQIVETAPETEGKAVASITLSLSSIGSDTQTPVTEFESEVTVKTYIAKELGSVDSLKLVYVSDGNEVATSETIKHEIKSYNSETGELVFITNHFSQFYVVSNKAQNYVAVNVTTDVGYSSFADAFDGAENGDVIRLVSDVEVTKSRSQFVIRNKTVEIDFAGYTISVATDCINGQGIFKVEGGGTLVFNDSSSAKTGKLDATAGNTGNVYAAICVWPQTNPGKATLIINGGTFIGYYYAIAGNGTYVSEPLTEIVINGGILKSVASDGLGIYHPQYGNLTVNDGEISGSETAVEIRAGNLDINGGKFVSTYETFSVNPNGSGTTTKGAAIAVSQHTTAKPISVDISGGRFEGVRPLNQSNPQNNPSAEESKVVLNISGGEFISTDSSADAVSIASVECTGFITGGTFSVKPSDAYVARGYVAKEFDSVWTVSEDGVEKGFSGGAGTKTNPYVITSEEEFAKISSLAEEMEEGAYYYFSVDSDLDYSTGDANPHILKFRGEIDFNGHTLGGLSFARLAELNGGTANNLIEECYGGAIRNLDYQPVGQCNLVFIFEPNNEENKELLLENITAGKDTEPRFDVGVNGGSFACEVFGPAKLVMRNCTNYCDIDVIGSGYAGIFLSGYGLYSAELVFENCDNYGTIYAKNYGFLIGNDNGINNQGYSSITATNCDNHGEIYATQSCGFVGWDDEKYTSVYTGSNNTTGTIKKLDSVSAQTSLSKDNVITVSGLDSGKYTSYEIVAYGYGDLKSTDGGGGTLRIVVSSGRIEITDSSTFKKLNFIDKAHAGNVFADDAYGNEIATVDGVEYYSIDLDSLGTALYDVEFKAPDYTLSELTYSLNVYDQEGNLAGSKTLTF